MYTLMTYISIHCTINCASVNVPVCKLMRIFDEGPISIRKYPVGDKSKKTQHILNVF